MERVYAEKLHCTGCGLCSVSCPTSAITMKDDTEGFLYPVVNTEICIDCRQCESICPEKITVDKIGGTVYGLRCNDPELLRSSTSGGAFSLLAQVIIRNGGLVSGACFDDDFAVRHHLSTDITPMRKSKYIQSNMVSQYAIIQNALEEGKEVMFTGTPCQCHAIKTAFRGKDAGLIIVAILCRGVMSPGLWRDYVSYLGGGNRLTSYDFRSKWKSDNAHTIAYRLEGQAEQHRSFFTDPLGRIYSKCIALRPSCYGCRYCSPELPFDFSIGDFWGIERIAPKLNDGKGVSLVIVRSKRAEALLEEVKLQTVVLTCPIEKALQPALMEPAKASVLRKLLFKDYEQKDADGRSNISLILKKYGG